MSELSRFIQINGLILGETNAEDKLNACFSCWEHWGFPVAFRVKKLGTDGTLTTYLAVAD